MVDNIIVNEEVDKKNIVSYEKLKLKPHYYYHHRESINQSIRGEEKNVFKE